MMDTGAEVISFTGVGKVDLQYDGPDDAMTRKIIHGPNRWVLYSVAQINKFTLSTPAEF